MVHQIDGGPQTTQVIGRFQILQIVLGASVEDDNGVVGARCLESNIRNIDTTLAVEGTDDASISPWLNEGLLALGVTIFWDRLGWRRDD